MFTAWIASPPVAGFLLTLLVVLVYRLSGRWAARGPDSTGKHLPYACGEDFGPETAGLSYQRFFRLALMFVVVHMAVLVVALLPRVLGARMLATAYLLGVAICIDVLLVREDE